MQDVGLVGDVGISAMRESRTVTTVHDLTLPVRAMEYDSNGKSKDQIGIQTKGKVRRDI